MDYNAGESGIKAVVEMQLIARHMQALVDKVSLNPKPRTLNNKPQLFVRHMQDFKSIAYLNATQI